LIIEANRYNPVSYVSMVKVAKHEHFSQKQLKKIVNQPNGQLITTETHVWPPRLKKPGKLVDVTFKLPLLKGIRNYNFFLFDV